MPEKLHSIEIRGRAHRWSFHIYIDPKYLDEWRADGLEINEICNVIPAWAVNLGLTKFWCFVQDVFHMKNPFK